MHVLTVPSAFYGLAGTSRTPLTLIGSNVVRAAERKWLEEGEETNENANVNGRMY